MKRKVLAIMRKLARLAWTIFSYFANNQHKIVGQKDNAENSNLITALSKCHYCNGTGWVIRKGTVEEHLPSRNGFPDGVLFPPCPICKGIGYINIPPTGDDDQNMQ